MLEKRGEGLVLGGRVEVSEDTVEGLLVGTLPGDPFEEAEKVPLRVIVVVMVTVWESRVG